MASGFWGSKAAPPPPPPPFHSSSPQIDATTIVSLLFFVSLLGAAYAGSVRLLPSTSTKKTRVLFVWHLFDALIHLFFEGSFLWNCFFVSYSLPTSFNAAAKKHPRIKLLTPPDVYWLGREDRIYGASYGEGLFSKLWQEYAKADRRWGGADLGVVSLEVLTVFVGAPLACKQTSPVDVIHHQIPGCILTQPSVWICWLLRREERKGALKRWFWMVILATAELYGGE